MPSIADLVVDVIIGDKPLHGYDYVEELKLLKQGCLYGAREFVRDCAERIYDSGNIKLAESLADKIVEDYESFWPPSIARVIWAGEDVEEIGLYKKAEEIYKRAIDEFIEGLSELHEQYLFNDTDGFDFIYKIDELAQKYCPNRRKDLWKNAEKAYTYWTKKAKNENRADDYLGLLAEIRSVLKKVKKD